jgi:hypothetical protein
MGSASALGGDVVDPSGRGALPLWLVDGRDIRLKRLRPRDYGFDLIARRSGHSKFRVSRSELVVQSLVLSEPP